MSLNCTSMLSFAARSSNCAACTFGAACDNATASSRLAGRGGMSVGMATSTGSSPITWR